MKRSIYLMLLVGLTAPSLYSQVDNNLCPDDKHPHMIDLGLPSGTKWACCNVDATKPEEYGGYYAWGETETKDYYDWSTYVHCDGTRSTLHNIGDDIAGTEYDVAHVKWGESWHLPSVDQIQELLDNCTRSWSALNGVEGLRFTGVNGSVIFLPAASKYFLGKIVNEYPDGNYWSSSFNEGRGDKYHSYTLEFDSYECRVRESERRIGLSVRAVYSALPEPDFTIFPQSVVLTIGNSITINITTGSGNYEITNSNNDVVEAALYGTSIALTAKDAGSAVITVKDISSNKTSDISVSVKSPKSYVPAEAIDLGLPSGTLWASWNLGATAPEEYGEYFAWGEIEEKDYYDWSTYIHCDGTAETCHYIGNNIAGTDYDPAQIKWGDPWRMPSRDQFAELIENCTRTWTSQNDTYGILFTGSNGNTIFIPAAGNRIEDYININGTHCIYWVSSVYRGSEGWAWNAIMNSEVQYLTDGARYQGEPIRPICLTKPIPDLSISQDSVELNVGNTAFIEITSGSGNYEITNSNTSVVEATLDGTLIKLKGLSEGKTVVTVKDLSSARTADIFVAVKSAISYVPAEAIDLGLPSGTLWASWNVGATKPEEYGGYYAWGETEVKEYYDWTTYLHSDGTAESCHFIGDDIAGSQHDVAHVKWGGSWQMPSEDQFKELCNNCTRTWTTQNGVNGTLVTGPNGNSIFFPASGLRRDNELRSAGRNGEYWSSTYYSDSVVWYFYFIPNYWVWYDLRERFYGNAVRPVICQEEPHPLSNRPFFIYRNDNVLDAYACSEIDSITYKNENGIFNQVIWQKEEANTIPVSIIDSISFEVPRNIILQIPEEDLNGWDLGYSLGDEYVVAYWDETDSTLVTMINKNGGEEEAGLILCYDVDGNVIKVGNVTMLYNVEYIDDSIVLSRLNDEGFFEEEIIPILYNNPSLAKQSTSTTTFSYFWYCTESGIKFIDNIQSAQSISQDLINWDWVQTAKDVGITTLGVLIGRNPLTGTIWTVGQWYINLCIRQLNERDRKIMYRDCTIEIDEIRPDNGNCVVYATVKNANTLYDYLVNMYDRTENEKTRNLVSCGIVIRVGNDYVTTHLYDYKSQETQLNGDIRYGSEAYFTFTIPGVNLTNNLATFYFRPYLTSTRIKTSRGDVDEGHIKYGETVPYQAFDGEIIEFNQYDAQYSTDEYNSGFVMFKTSVHASVGSLDNVEEWGVYVYDLNGSGVYDLYPSEYRAAKLEDWIDIDFNINKDEFDEINNDVFLATKNIKLGVYIKINNPTGNYDYLSLFYSEPQQYELVYSEKPSAITLDVVSTEITSAIVRCRYAGCVFWDVTCGIEYKSDNSRRTKVVFPEDDNEQEIVLTGLTPSTTYTYRAYFIANGDYHYGEIHEFTTKSGCPDDNHPHAIDLGLPSGTKWACCNVADDPTKQSPTNYGSYYAWGETSEKSVYNEVNYPYSSGVDEDGDGWYDDFHEDTSLYGSWQNIGDDIAGTKYDVAHVKWGKPWRMPSFEQIVELWNSSIWNWTTKNGKPGILFIGPNGGSIFLPAAGERWDDDFENKDEYGQYWSSSFYPPAKGLGAYILGFNLYGWLGESYYRYAGLTVRPVCP